MDNDRFDWLARAVAGGDSSRRRLLVGLAGGALSCAVGPAALAAADAQK